MRMNITIAMAALSAVSFSACADTDAAERIDLLEQYVSELEDRLAATEAELPRIEADFASQVSQSKLVNTTLVEALALKVDELVAELQDDISDRARTREVQALQSEISDLTDCVNDIVDLIWENSSYPYGYGFCRDFRGGFRF